MTPTAGAPEPKILRREWTSVDVWRETRVGLWAWLLQRVSAVLLLGAIALHLVNPFRREVQAVLLALALLHALLGVRALALDLGAPVHWHRPMFVAAVAFAAILFAAIWGWRWY